VCSSSFSVKGVFVNRDDSNLTTGLLAIQDVISDLYIVKDKLKGVKSMIELKYNPQEKERCIKGAFAKASYQRGDIVRFKDGAEYREGTIMVVDTIGLNEASYDIFNLSELVIYKHYEESKVDCLLTKASPDTISQMEKALFANVGPTREM